MNKKNYKYIYGPVPSWRLGSSLGIDPVSCKEKICSYDCIYCQLGRTTVLTKKRKVFVPTSEIVEEIKTLPTLNIDYITFSGRGEPTLAKNLGEMIAEVKKIRTEPVAVLTNASLLHELDVREDLLRADFVITKLDSDSDSTLKRVNRPVWSINQAKVLDGIRKFLKDYKGKFALQIMFAKENELNAKGIASLAKKIGPDEVQLNTPLRPCAVKPLLEDKMKKIEKYFEGLNVVSVYNIERKKVEPVSKKETLKRRGKV